MQVTYDGAHSVIFGDKHSWDDWHLIPVSRPVVSPPKVNTNTIEIPGSNGTVDLTDTILGFPTYKNRTGSFQFYVDNSRDDWDWDIAYGEIMAYLHGFKCDMTLTDDRSYYYIGRFAVDSWKSDKHYSTITISYDLEPYKYMVWTTTGDWLWNPFDFKNGLIIDQSTFTIPVSGDGWSDRKTWNSDLLGLMPLTPTFNVMSMDGNGIDIHYKNENQNDFLSIDRSSHEFHLNDGLNSNPQIMFATPRPGDYVRMQFKGYGVVTIDYRPGRL